MLAGGACFDALVTAGHAAFHVHIQGDTDSGGQYTRAGSDPPERLRKLFSRGDLRVSAGKSIKRKGTTSAIVFGKRSMCATASMRSAVRVRGRACEGSRHVRARAGLAGGAHGHRGLSYVRCRSRGFGHGTLVCGVCWRLQYPGLQVCDWRADRAVSGGRPHAGDGAQVRTKGEAMCGEKAGSRAGDSMGSQMGLSMRSRQ